MRPIDLTPAEERRGSRSQLRSGPIAYIVVGALVAALAGISLLVLAGNQISEREAEVAELRREDAQVKAKAHRLAAYTQFQTVSRERVDAVHSLADSRFDWQRVMRELSLILPSDVWINEMTATATPQVSINGGGGESSGGGGSDLRGGAAGPALEIHGCSKGQDGVAGFLTALEDIDGVTRVGFEESALPATGSATGTEEGDSATSCQTRKFIAKFQIVIAFDAAPLPPDYESEEAVVAAEPEASGEEAPEGESSE